MHVYSSAAWKELEKSYCCLQGAIISVFTWIFRARADNHLQVLSVFQDGSGCRLYRVTLKTVFFFMFFVGFFVQCETRKQGQQNARHWLLRMKESIVS